MAATHYRTLVIETGVMCNNRCTFCYQRGYRALAGYPKLLPGDEVRERMRWGLSNGFDEVSFTGGEPTIRPDFLDLVREAREMGYRRVAITTNGWKLAHPEFFRQAADAGLTSMGVSVHGPEASIHDAATGHPGSFERALQAIRNAIATYHSGRPVRLNTFTVIHRGNVARLDELGRLLSGLGVRLMVFQPAILGKSNFLDASQVQVALPEVVEGLRRVVLEGIERHFRVKLFNLPPCLFRDVLRGLDLDAYERATFRDNDRERPGQRTSAREEGYVRLPACESCVLAPSCPGLHVTLMPQEDLAAHFEESLGAISAWHHPQVWLAGTDLMRPATLYRVVRKTRLAGFEDVRVTSGGSSIWGSRAGLVALRQAGASELVLVHHPRDPRSADRIVCQAGNDLYLERMLADLSRSPPEGLRLSLLVGPEDAALDLLARPAVADLLENLPFRLYLRAPWRADDGPGLKTHLLARFLSGAGRLPVRPLETVLLAPWPRAFEAAWALPAAALRGLGRLRFDVTGTVMPTAFADRHYSVLNWSLPHLGGKVLVEGGGGLLPVRPLLARSVRGQPVTRESLLAARMPGGLPAGEGPPPPPPRPAPGSTPPRGP